MYCSNDMVSHIREASCSLIRELGLLSASLGGKELPASAVRALIEIGDSTSTTSSSLNKTLNLESSNFGWILAKLVDTGAVIEISSTEDTRHKILSITDKGKRILSKIDSLVDERVMNALEKLPETSSREQVLHGIRSYAAALRAQRLEEEEDKPVEKLVISSGYRPGLLGRCLEILPPRSWLWGLLRKPAGDWIRRLAKQAGQPKE
ncbi:hypothetical protein L207DRAFT_316525 [Hyaloscypha variabilis F]|uniref:HTH marR-type domain-containing protein n=1 Tax=Hyaloscypha variabilis (strain UAMH 11265 / GT02V1 / F) TaxID=1149755 RepID=A0A2J6RVQ0_HYAVF|nr:hypothetical protein L207DRAFT_316525 [Hyaloscypha variabilis F]